MTQENYNYRYTIDTVDISLGTFLITYIPEDINLSPFSLNVRLLEKDYKTILNDDGSLKYLNQNEVPFIENLKHTIDFYKPINDWRMQNILLQNVDGINNTTANVSVTVTENTYVMDLPNGNTATVTDHYYKSVF